MTGHCETSRLNETGDAVMAPAPKVPIKGRGALGNPTGRFESIEIEPDPEAEPTETIRTRYYRDHTQSILTTNDSPDVGFNISVNPYRGCEHGCIYCYARPTHEYFGLSCGLDFESKIFVKMNAPQLLREALSKKSWVPQSIAISGITDCYQPVERRLKLTRQCLEVLADFRNPVGLITKNHLITRDVDILQELARYQAVRVFISVTTLDESVARVMEPRTASPALRLDAIRQLSKAGIPVGVMMAPVVPGLTDHEIDAVLKTVSEAGARTAGYVMLRLPYGVKDLFQSWLEAHFPMRKNKVLSHIKDIRGGQLNNAEFGRRMVGQGQYAEIIARMFELSAKRYGLDQPLPPMSAEHFRNPAGQQLRLF